MIRTTPAALVLATSLFTGCAAVKLDAPITGYLCCNVAVTDGWVYSSNVRGGAMLPFGEEVTLTSLKRQRYAYGTVAALGVGFGNDAAPEGQTMAWLQRTVVREDPRREFETWPAHVRSAVDAGKIFVGMTRAQTVMSIGYPSAEDTPDLASPTWTYWLATDDAPVRLKFDGGGVLESISASAAGRRVIELRP